MIDIKIEYRPCECHNFDKIMPGMIPTNYRAPESFDSKKAAAFRVREHLEADRKCAVHHQGLHVSAVTINNIRYEAF